MKKDKIIGTIIIVIIIVIGLIVTDKFDNNNAENSEPISTPLNLFYEYSDNIINWNLYDGKKAPVNSTETGYSYYIFNPETEENDKNQLLISYSDFPYWFGENTKYFSTIFNGRSTEKKLDLGKDLRNNRSSKNYPNSDITNKYNIERKVTLHGNEDNNYKTEYYYTSYMDIYVNSNNEIIYAIPKDIRSISYVTQDEINTDAVQENQTLLEGEKINNIERIIDSLGEPNYAIATSDEDASQLTYVWKISKNYYFYYTMKANYYLEGIRDKVKVKLTGESISGHFEYGIVNRNYVFYTNIALSMLFDAINNNYIPETWIVLNK